MSSSPLTVNVAIGVLAEGQAATAGHAGWRVLIARRLGGAVYAGYWEFPGGKVEHGESPAECVVREFREELGLSVLVGEALTVFEHVYSHGRVRIHPFFCRRQAARPGGALPAPQDLGVSEHRWVTPLDLRDYLFLPANRGLTEQLISILSQPAA